MRTLDGKVCMVTGAAGGLGLALAECLASRGGRLVLVDIREPELGAATAAIRGSVSVLADVTSSDGMERAVAAALERWGRVDLLINNAGVGVIGQLTSLPLEVVEAAFRLNVFAAIRGIQAVAPVMRQQGSGLIVQISSGRSADPSPDSPVYAATKAALNVLSAALRKELAGSGVEVMTVFPGPLNNDFNAHSLYASEAERLRRLSVGGTPTTRTPAQAAAEIVAAIESGADRFPADVRPLMPL